MILRCMATMLSGMALFAILGCSPGSKKSPAATGVKSSTSDWPQWRYDAYRSANSSATLPERLHLQWVRRYSQRVQVWDDPLNHDLMQYDKLFEPVVLGKRMFVNFNDRDKVVALDVDTGQELWAFYTDGPVRLAPAAWQDKVYFCSDDGWLYCVTADSGSLVWKFRGGPSSRKALGNGRVISAWPARGGPAIRDGEVYFAASIWPFMGTFIYSLDAQAGKVLWVNNGTGSQYIKQPHSAPAFAGVAPQGALVATRNYLLVPGGRSVPAAFDRKTGRLMHFEIEDSGRGNGGSFVAANDSEYFVHTRYRGTRQYDFKNGKKTSFGINEPVLAEEGFYSGQEYSGLKAALVEAQARLASALQTEADEEANVARVFEDNDKDAYKKATNALASARRKVARAKGTVFTNQMTLGTNWASCVIQAVGTDKKTKWELLADGTGDIIRVGRRLYVAGTNALLAIELPLAKKSSNPPQPRIVWSNYVDSRVLRLLAADGKLFAVTLDGRIMAFGEDRKEGGTLSEERTANPPSPTSLARAREILNKPEAREGYALCFGVEDAELLQALALESKLHITAVTPDAAVVEKLRRQLDAAGLYGDRVTLHAGDPVSFKAPPYIANLVVIGDAITLRLGEPEMLQTAYQSVRPYGGTLWISTAKVEGAALANRVKNAALTNAVISVAQDYVAVLREGPLPGSGNWTHQYGDIGNSVKSDDQLVKLPLGVLWFGGPTHLDVLPRHGHGPSEQVIGGRLFIEGINSLSARDVYTGRVLWKTEFEDLGNYGVYYDSSYANTPLGTNTNQKHISGANARGANFIATEDAVYLAVSNACLVLDARTGQVTRRLEMPRREGELGTPDWAYIGVYDNVLLGGANFAHYTTRFLLYTNKGPFAIDRSASQGLVAFDRHTGKMLWRVDARYSFLHNGIIAGNGRLYCLDRLPKTATDRLKRRGLSSPKDYRLTAFDIQTGQPLWQWTTNVVGTWLGYSRKYDVLLQAGASATDRLKDEADKGMTTYQASSGTVLWTKPDLKYSGPCILHNDLILTTPGSYKTNAGAFALLTGKPFQLRNPLTGNPEPLRIFRTYGCNYPIACEHLVTFRSGAAGFYDLETHSGTGNLGGFKSGCSPNLIAADGVLNAPDYTRTCSCPYQNQTSLAFVHMPELEVWTHNQYGVDAKDGVRIKRLGVNFGAPGDHLAPSGTLWVDYPNASGSSPNLWITVKGSGTNYFRQHISQMQGDGPAWVIASGIRNVESITIAPETRKQSSPPPAPAKKEDDDDDDASGTNTVAKSSTSTNSSSKASSSKTNRTETVFKSSLPPAHYTVRLYFAEPEDLRSGDRVFDVALQGRTVLHKFDIAAQAGGICWGIVKEFRNVLVKGELTIGFSYDKTKPYGPVLCGAEMLLEESLAGESKPRRSGL